MAKVDLDDISTSLVTFLKNEVVDSTVQLTEDTVLNEGLIDSFVIIELVLFLERTFKIKLSEQDLKPANFKTVKALASCAAEK